MEESNRTVPDDFDPLLFHGMVEFVTVYGKDDIRFTMKDGTEVKA